MTNSIIFWVLFGCAYSSFFLVHLGVLAPLYRPVLVLAVFLFHASIVPGLLLPARRWSQKIALGLGGVACGLVLIGASKNPWFLLFPVVVLSFGLNFRECMGLLLFLAASSLAFVSGENLEGVAAATLLGITFCLLQGKVGELKEEKERLSGELKAADRDKRRLMLAALNNAQRARQWHRAYLGVRNRDPVTGLVNYAYIIRHLEQLRIKGQRVPISVVLAEVKGLSELNMVKGYLYGNCVLRRSAVTFTGLVRTRDIVGRIGGGKFIFAFMHTGRWEAEAIAARIKLAFDCWAKPYGLSLIYAVMTIPDDCATMEELLDGVEAYLSFIGGGNPQRTKLANGGC